MKLPIRLLAVALAGMALALDHPKDTMCVKQKDGTYKCLASGKIEKEPCCDLGAENPPAKPKPKKKRKAAKS